MAKILLVDDDHDLAHLTRIALAKQGHDVSIFYDAPKAIEEAMRQVPDLILMDIMLPGVSGAQAVKRLKEVPELKNLPVIFLTALVSHEEDLEKTGINIDGKNYKTLGKPYDMEKLLGTVERSLMEQGELRS